MQRSRVYLDSGGSAPLSRRVTDALRAGFADGWANPARLSAESRRARSLVDGSREAIADALGARPELVHFTSSPHDAFARCLAGVHAARRGRGRIVVSAIERDALVNAATFVAPHAVDTVPVDSAGHVSIDALTLALQSQDVALAAVQHANQELGTVQRLEDVARATQSAEVPLLVDATSSIGHMDPPAYWDALVAHPADWGGPAGIGVLALEPHTRWLPAWPDGDDWAPGGVSVPLALASAVALQERQEARDTESARLWGLVDKIRANVAQLPGVDVLGDPHERLPHVLTFSCLYVDGEVLLGELDRRGFSVGSGSACVSGTLEPSRVLAAIGALTHGNVRLALHPGIADQDIDRFLAELPDALDTVRQRIGAPRITS
ncbi:aminotransferase class V-fold PLP-dependent enzyme [Demequina sp. TTPB684]|uniref:cysteine desulfurase family protein n=1 Tax=unclassified Demequina TaxID=2620311 RepID=UPI001CF2A08A|nr:MULTISPECIES: aminotransferase class V-fold PLP-dependent enzyme [unclassified Demequina]MCB2413824.1 aminotransferase class V-fold PLP-dependent enzyme [Demequina sp. TTPB684]UPU89137.1 aminotransferase class V-fold PLP-dependent enzyme [Demequina sp. TMPB413]